MATEKPATNGPLPWPKVQAFAHRHGLDAALVHDRLNRLVRGYLRHPGAQGFNERLVKHERLLRESLEAGEELSLDAAVAVALEQERARRHGRRRPLTVGAALRRALAQPRGRGRPTNWRAAYVYRGLAFLWRDATGKLPTVSRRRPRGRAWRFFKDAIALLQAAGLDDLQTSAGACEHFIAPYRHFHKPARRRAPQAEHPEQTEQSSDTVLGLDRIDMSKRWRR